MGKIEYELIILLKTMNILIATQNQDKFRIIKGLLSNCGLSDCLFKNLNDVNIESQSEEYGDLINRALMKAQYAHNAIDKEEQIDIFVGVDDGMKYKNGKTDENSKEITEKILHHDLLDIGEALINVRALVFLDREGKVIDKFEIEFLFKFIGNKNNIKLQDARYPLSHVLSSLEGEKSMAEMGEEESMSYYLLFPREKIVEAVSKIDKKE
jgi:hypothetical protein